MGYNEAPASQRILLIEDNQEMADNIASILALAQYDVLCAYNGKHGVALANEGRPDLILCDIMMPELDGFGVLHILQQDPETANIPFVFLSARADKTEIRQGMNLGADDYITKPFDTTDLLKLIETRLKKSDGLKSQFSANHFSYHSVFSEARERKALELLLAGKSQRLYRRKEFVYLEEQTSTEVFFLQNGEIKTYKANHDGKELITGLYGQGEFFGYVSVLEERPYHDNAEVVQEAQIVTVPRQEFVQLIYSSKDLARKFIRITAGKLAEAEDRMLELAYQSVRQRVAGSLLKLQALVTAMPKTRHISICRKDISCIVGTATESLNRTLADFKDEGLVEISDEGIRIVNQQKLEKILR
jgi:DNA-binding response OmpR family regulator